MSFSSNYLRTRDSVISKCTPCSDTDLQKLIEKFESRIKSKRSSSYCTNVGDLIRVLEKRYILNEHDISCFSEILTTLNKTYTCNVYNSVNETTCNFSNNQGTPVLNFTAETYREKIYELIIDEIGFTWKLLARNLRISEGNIDKLEERYHLTPSERIREMLKYYEKMYPENWFPLLDALSKSRRSGLRNKVQEILNNRK